jgi:hypothetical protein
VRDIVEDVALRVLTGRMVNAYVVADRLAEAGKGPPRQSRLWL